MPQGQPPRVLDAKEITNFLTSMKRQLSQVDGEIITMRADAMGSMFQAMANVLNQVFTSKMVAEEKVEKLQEKLNKIYQGHPDIKISMEEKKEKAKIKDAPQTKPKMS